MIALMSQLFTSHPYLQMEPLADGSIFVKDEQHYAIVTAEAVLFARTVPQNWSTQWTELWHS